MRAGSQKSRDGIRKDRSRESAEVTDKRFVQGKKITMVANFHEDLEKTRFFEDVQESPMPSAVLQLSKDRFPREAFGFTLKWGFKQAKFWLKNQKSKARPGK